MVDAVEILMTSDRFECEILASAVRSEGFAVKLLHDEGAAAAGGPGFPSRLVVRSEDEDAVRKILQRSQEL